MCCSLTLSLSCFLCVCICVCVYVCMCLFSTTRASRKLAHVSFHASARPHTDNPNTNNLNSSTCPVVPTHPSGPSKSPISRMARFRLVSSTPFSAKIYIFLSALTSLAGGLTVILTPVASTWLSYPQRVALGVGVWLTVLGQGVMLDWKHGGKISRNYEIIRIVIFLILGVIMLKNIEIQSLWYDYLQVFVCIHIIMLIFLTYLATIDRTRDIVGPTAPMDRCVRELHKPQHEHEEEESETDVTGIEVVNDAGSYDMSSGMYSSPDLNLNKAAKAADTIASSSSRTVPGTRRARGWVGIRSKYSKSN